MNVPIFFYLTDIVILFVGIPQTLTPLFKLATDGFITLLMYSDPIIWVQKSPNRGWGV